MALKLVLCLLTIGCVAARFDDPWFKPYENATTLYKAANGFINRLPLVSSFLSPTACLRLIEYIAWGSLIYSVGCSASNRPNRLCTGQQTWLR